MKSLTKEQKRMRELMGFTYKDNSHDILSEQNIKKSTKRKSLITERLSKVLLNEQVNNPEEIAELLQKEINDVLAKKADTSILDTMVHLKYDPMGNYMSLIFTDGTELILRPEGGGKFVKKIPYEIRDYPNPEGPQYAPIVDVVTPIRSIQPNYDMTEIFNQVVEANPTTLGRFFEADNEVSQFIKKQVVNAKPSFNWLPEQGGVELIVSPTYEYKKPKQRPKNSTKFNDENITTDFTLAAFTESVGPMPLWYNYRVGEPLKPISDLWIGTVKMKGATSQELIQIEITLPTELLDNKDVPIVPPVTNDCECEDLTTGEMIKYPCDGPKPPECIEDITPIELKLDLVDAFAFDKVENPDDTSWWHKDDGGEQFENFIDTYNATKKKYSMVWDQYLEFLKDKGVIVYGYASIDGDSDEDMRGNYKDCNSDGQLSDTSAMQPRHKYNQCLSEKRAVQVIKDIVALLPELDGILKPIGKGETDKFNGKRYPANSDATAPNRRVNANFPKFKTKIKN